MRFLILAVILLNACAKEPAPPAGARVGTYVGPGRDALCVAGAGDAQRAGLIVYGDGQRNCSISGKLDQGILTPNGDSDCRIPLQFLSGMVTIGTVPAACEYYCGYDKNLSGEQFRLKAGGAKVTDLVGDPLC